MKVKKKNFIFLKKTQLKLLSGNNSISHCYFFDIMSRTNNITSLND